METVTCESLGELEKAVETLACGSCSHSTSINQSINFNLNSHKHFYSVEKKKIEGKRTNSFNRGLIVKSLGHLNSL